MNPHAEAKARIDGRRRHRLDAPFRKLVNGEDAVPGQGSVEVSLMPSFSRP
jgi:hypothetical protein